MLSLSTCHHLSTPSLSPCGCGPPRAWPIHHSHSKLPAWREAGTHRAWCKPSPGSCDCAQGYGRPTGQVGQVRNSTPGASWLVQTPTLFCTSQAPSSIAYGLPWTEPHGRAGPPRHTQSQSSFAQEGERQGRNLLAQETFMSTGRPSQVFSPCG